MASVHLTRRNALFLHIPKTAGFSFTKALQDGFDDAVAYPVRDLRFRKGAAAVLQSNVGRRCMEEVFLFAIVRNPWDWMVSGWKHVTANQNAYGAETPSFENFVLGGWSKGLVRNPNPRKFSSPRLFVAYHTQMTQWDHLSMRFGRRLAPVDHFGRFERLQDEWGDIC